jgi:hypothetical protein
MSSYSPPDFSCLPSFGFYFSSLRPGHEEENQTKIDYWTDLIKKSQEFNFHQHGEISFTESELLSRFDYQGERPLCLPSIIEILKSTGQLAPLPLLPASNSSQSNSLLRLASSVGRFALSFLSPTRSHSSSSSDRFVLFSLFSFACSEAFEQLKTEEILPLELIMNKIKKWKSYDVEAILKQLIDSGRAVEVFGSLDAESVCESVRVFKFSASQQVQTVQHSIGQLKSAIHNCELSISSLESRIQSEVDKAKQLIKQNNLQAAKRRLHFKSKLTASVSRAHEKVINLEELLIMMEQQKSQASIINAMKSANNALKEARRVSPSEEEINQLMEEIEDSVQEHQSAEQELAQPIKYEQKLSEEELEEEYEKLLKELEQDKSTSDQVKNNEEIQQITQTMNKINVNQQSNQNPVKSSAKLLV